MYCTKCGVKNDDSGNLCHRCGLPLKKYSSAVNVNGNKRENVIKKVLLKIIPAVLAAAATIATVPAAAVLPKADTFVFTVANNESASPEEAVRRFLESVKELDIEAALAYFTINEYATRYDTVGQYVRMKQFQYHIPRPTQYEFYQAINQISQIGSCLYQIQILIFSLSPSEAVINALESARYTIQSDPKLEAKAFVDAVNPTVVRDLKIISIDLPNPDKINHYNQSQGGQRNTRETMEIYGCEELTDRVALFTINGAYYYCGFSLIRYEEGWKILSLYSIWADISPPNKIAQKTTPEEYAVLISRQSGETAASTPSS